MPTFGRNYNSGRRDQPQCGAKSSDPLYARDEKLLLEIVIPPGETIQVDKEGCSYRRHSSRKKDREGGEGETTSAHYAWLKS